MLAKAVDVFEGSCDHERATELYYTLMVMLVGQTIVSEEQKEYLPALGLEPRSSSEPHPYGRNALSFQALTIRLNSNPGDSPCEDMLPLHHASQKWHLLSFLEYTKISRQ